MAKFEKGNQLWKNNPAFKKNIGRYTKEIVHSEEHKKACQDARDRYKAIENLKVDIFEQMTGSRKLDKGIERILTNAIKDGDTKQFVDLLKLITPKEVDVTSGGKTIQMQNIVVDGEELNLDIGQDVQKEEK